MTEQSIVHGAWARSFNGAAPERRDRRDRRSVTLKTFVYGAFKARRRSVRRDNCHFVHLDWHEPQLFALSIAVLILSLFDAVFTSTLLTRGAYEANPFLAYLIDISPSLFAAVKMSLTGLGVMALVACCRVKLFRSINAGSILPVCLLLYLSLIGYELWLLMLTS